MSKVQVEKQGNRLIVRFPYNYNDVKAVKTIKGRRHAKTKGYWTVPANVKAARALREVFGRRMVLGPMMRDWAYAEVQAERKLRRLQQADDAPLKHVPQILEDAIAGKKLPIRLPRGHPFQRNRPARPYQRADIAFMALGNCINSNDVGVGKTIEAIGALYEAELYPQPLIVVAPRRSLISVWRTELERFTDYDVYTSEDPKVRKALIETKVSTLNYDGPWALILIADDLRLERDRRKVDKKVTKDRRVNEEDPLYACNDYRGEPYRFRNQVQKDLYEVEYGAFIVDEFHKTGVNNRRSLFFVGAKLLKAKRKWFLSATPIGGKARRLWAVLNLLHPKVYSSEWNWIEENLELETKEIYKPGGHGEKQKVREVGEIQDHDAFYERHRLHMVRRDRFKVLPGLPRETEILVDTPMVPKQRNEYDKFDREHEIMLSGKRLSGSIVLAQYTRLRQMANTAVDWAPNGKIAATFTSGKLDQLLDRLDENGIRKTDYEPHARAYVGTLDISFAEVVHLYLDKAGIDNMLLTGKTKDSAPLLARFADHGERPFVIIMTVATGGTSLNMEQANSAHLLEEPWDPDQITQFFGRGSRGSRTTSLRCYTYRTPESIQEYVAEVAGDKKITNKNILDYVPQIEKLRSK